jgi:hypothetical protein
MKCLICDKAIIIGAHAATSLVKVPTIDGKGHIIHDECVKTLHGIKRFVTAGGEVVWNGIYFKDMTAEIRQHEKRKNKRKAV